MSRNVLDPPAVLPRRRRRVAATVGMLLLLASVLGVLAHHWPPRSAVLLGISAFAPYAMLLAPVALALLMAVRWWAAAAVAAVVCGLWVAALAPLYGAATPPAHARSMVIMTANLKLGEATPASLVAAVERNHVDVLMIEELTPSERSALRNAGLGDALPFHVDDPRPGAEGTGLWSRFALHDVDLRHDFSFAFVTARITVPGLSCDPVVAALHMRGPWPDAGHWDKDIDHLPAVLAELNAQPCALLVGGDFNATPDVAQFRGLLSHGIADAAAQAGGGVTGTYPADTWLPPLIAIDHVLTRDAVATSVHTVDIAGSDHRALVAHVAVRRSASGSG